MVVGVASPRLWLSLVKLSLIWAVESMKLEQKLPENEDLAASNISLALSKTKWSGSLQVVCMVQALVVGVVYLPTSWSSLVGAAPNRADGNRRIVRLWWGEVVLTYTPLSHAPPVGKWSESGQIKCRAPLLIMGEVSPPKFCPLLVISARGWPSAAEIS